jgi:hypothetical protein
LFCLTIHCTNKPFIEEIKYLLCEAATTFQLPFFGYVDKALLHAESKLNLRSKSLSIHIVQCRVNSDKIKKQPGCRNKFPGLLRVPVVMGTTGLVPITTDQRNNFQSKMHRTIRR